jgi:hypothetical protein
MSSANRKQKLERWRRAVRTIIDFHQKPT